MAVSVPPSNIRLEDLVEIPEHGGRWHFPYNGGEDGGEYSSIANHEWLMAPTDAPASRTDEFYGRPSTVYYDPARTQVSPGEFRHEYTNKGNRITDLNPPAGMLWRGMSDEEYQAAVQNGYFESPGEYNIGGESQVGKTYFSTGPDHAESYANGFAPWQYRPTFTRPGHIIGIPDRPDIPREGGHEVGIPGRIPFDEAVHHYVGHPYAIAPGTYRGISNKYDGQWDEVPPYRSQSANAYLEWEDASPVRTVQAAYAAHRWREGSQYFFGYDAHSAAADGGFSEPVNQLMGQAAHLAMAWDEWAPKIKGGCQTCTDGWEGRYTIPQAGAFLNYAHATHQGQPAVKVIGIYTHPSDRGDGVAEALMRRLADDHPGAAIIPGMMTTDGQHFHDRMLDKEPTARDRVTAQAKTAPDLVKDYTDSLSKEFHDWAKEQPYVPVGFLKDDPLVKNPDYSQPMGGPLAYWENIEGFLQDRYPAVHRGFAYGQESAAATLDGQRVNFPPRHEGFHPPYETGPEAVEKYGYDPRQVAAGFMYLHSLSHSRAQRIPRDIDRLSEIFQKRQQMQRDYEKRQVTAGYGDPMGEQDWNEIYPTLPDTIHRGIGVSLPDDLHRMVHDPSIPVEQRAVALLKHINTPEARVSPWGNDSREGLGTSWSGYDGVAEDFARQSASQLTDHNQSQANDDTWGLDEDGDPVGKPATAVMLRALRPELDEIDDDPNGDGSGMRYTYNGHGEQEVPVRGGSSLNISGISWRPILPMFHPDYATDPEEYTHHDFGADNYHYAARTASSLLVGPEDAYDEWDWFKRHYENPPSSIDVTTKDWYHVSPHRMPVGTVLAPMRGDTPWNDSPYDHGLGNRANWVWVEFDKDKARQWMRYVLQHQPECYIYRVEPELGPFAWNGTADEGWVTTRARVTEYLDRISRDLSFQETP